MKMTKQGVRNLGDKPRKHNPLFERDETRYNPTVCPHKIIRMMIYENLTINEVCAQCGKKM